MVIALCNIPVIWESPDLNIELCNSVADSVIKSNSGVELILFPEFFTYGFSVNSLLHEEGEGKTLRWMMKCAKEHKIAIYGSVPTKDGNIIYNRGYFVKPDQSYFCYDKRHLFSYGGENRYFTKGHNRVVINYKDWSILLQICYDLRFPVWSRNINEDYELVLNIASWPASRSNVIKPLAISRAIENVSYYAFLNRSGSDPKSYYSGESFIASFDNTFVNPDIIDTNNFYSIFKLDKDSLHKQRSKFPFLKDSDNFKILL